MGGPGDIHITKEIRVSPSDLTELIVSLGGVKFWIVAVAPLYIGWVLAQPAATRHLFVDDLRVVLGIFVVGPLLGTFTLLLNVYYDMGTTDRVNPRKKYVQVVEEDVSAAAFTGLEAADGEGEEVAPSRTGHRFLWLVRRSSQTC